MTSDGFVKPSAKMLNICHILLASQICNILSPVSVCKKNHYATIIIIIY